MMEPKDRHKLEALVRKYDRQIVETELGLIAPSGRKGKPKKNLETLNQFDRDLIANYFIAYRNDHRTLIQLIVDGKFDGRKHTRDAAKKRLKRLLDFFLAAASTRELSQGPIVLAQQLPNRDK